MESSPNGLFVHCYGLYALAKCPPRLCTTIDERHVIIVPLELLAATAAMRIGQKHGGLPVHRFLALQTPLG